MIIVISHVGRLFYLKKYIRLNYYLKKLATPFIILLTVFTSINRAINWPFNQRVIKIMTSFYGCLPGFQIWFWNRFKSRFNKKLWSGLKSSFQIQIQFLSRFQIQNRFEIQIKNLCKILFLLINLIEITLSDFHITQKLYII